MTEEQMEMRKQKARERAKKWALENPDRVRDYKKKYKETNRERLREYNKLRYQENADHYRQYQKEYKAAHPEYMRKYREENKEDILARRRDYYRENANHCVYCLELPDGMMYIGSTEHLGWRLSVHKQDYKNEDWKHYRAIREAGGWDQVRVHVLMKDIPDYDLRLRLEQHFIDMVPEELSLNTLNAVQKAS